MTVLTVFYIYHSFKRIYVFKESILLIKYWKNFRTKQSIFLVLDFIVHFSHYMFRPRFEAILKWFANTKNIYGNNYIY
jgi:hypothetical protein